MATSDILNSMKTHIQNAYDVIEAAGGLVPENKNIENLPMAIRTLVPAPITLIHTGGSGTAILYNKWIGTITVNDTDEIFSGGNKEYTFTEGDNKRLVITGTNEVLSQWRYNYNPIIKSTTVKFEADVPDMRVFMIDDHTAGDYFFNSFNNDGALTSLSIGSFNTSNITTVGGYFLEYFNRNGALTSLPIGSFNTSNITTVGNDFFNSFNNDGALTSLPIGSFNTSNITTVGNNFFSSFNRNGALTSLPIGSFNTSNITTVGNNFFKYFNYGGGLIEGNRKVSIYAAAAILDFNIGSQNSIAKGNYGYVNGT